MRYFMLLLLLLFGTAVIAMANGYTAIIKQAVDDGELVINPTVNSPKQETLRYELISSKQGTNGTSRTNQSGTVTTQASQPISLATLKLAVSKSDHYTITLRVYADDILVAKDEIHYP